MAKTHYNKIVLIRGSVKKEKRGPNINEYLQENTKDKDMYIPSPRYTYSNSNKYQILATKNNTLRIHDMKCKTIAMKEYTVDPCHQGDHSNEKIQCGSMS
jgi:hypothetical protein